MNAVRSLRNKIMLLFMIPEVILIASLCAVILVAPLQSLRGLILSMIVANFLFSLIVARYGWGQISEAFDESGTALEAAQAGAKEVSERLEWSERWATAAQHLHHGLVRSNNPTDLARYALEPMFTALGMTFAGLWLYDEPGQLVRVDIRADADPDADALHNLAQKALAQHKFIQEPHPARQFVTAIPLGNQKKEIDGALAFYHMQPLRENEQLRLAAYISYAAYAIENTRLSGIIAEHLVQDAQREDQLACAEVERTRLERELKLLKQVISTTVSNSDIRATLEIICGELVSAFNLKSSAAALLNDDGLALTVMAECKTDPGPSALGATIPVEGNPATLYVLKQKAPLALSDAQHDMLMTPVHELMHQREIGAILILPILIKDQVVGTIGMDFPQAREITVAEIALATSVTAAAARSLEYAWIQEKLTD